MENCFNILKESKTSAQEAMYTCLIMKQSNSSTRNIFINTSHLDKRTRMLKPKAVGEIVPKSIEIYVEGFLEHYSHRPYQTSPYIKIVVEKVTKNDSYSDNNDTDAEILDESETVSIRLSKLSILQTSFLEQPNPQSNRHRPGPLRGYQSVYRHNRFTFLISLSRMPNLLPYCLLFLTY